MLSAARELQTHYLVQRQLPECCFRHLETACSWNLAVPDGVTPARKAGAGASLWQEAQLGQEDKGFFCCSCKNWAEISDAIDQLGHLSGFERGKMFARSPAPAGQLYHLVPYWLGLPVP